MSDYYQPKEPFDGFEEADYIDLMSQVDHNETQQAHELGKWLIANLGLPNDSFVVDLGCNNGLYLVPFREAGWCIWGVDAIPYVPNRHHIPDWAYDRFDLRYPYTRNGPKADLCICCETMEHMEEHWHPILVDSCCRVSDTILFTCAVPGQGGMWHKGERSHEDVQAMFAAVGYGLHPLHEKLKAYLPEMPGVQSWLRDNTFLFAKGSVAEGHGANSTVAVSRENTHLAS